mmetsp:Transcript_1319/g.4791  ORF Transcript_1319/g.4791 Transcript_1319/m.4791 type:complete len:237 (-) Transcript_1319:121-831(-)
MPTRALTVTSTGALALSRFMTTEMSALTVCSISPRSSHTICRRARSSASSRSFSARAASRSARSAASCAALASASAFNRASSLAFSSAFFRRNSARISSRRFSSSSAALASASACIRANVSCRSRSRASSSSRTRRRSFSAVSSRSLRSARNSASRTRSSSVISRAAPLEPTPAPAPARRATSTPPRRVPQRHRPRAPPSQMTSLDRFPTSTAHHRARRSTHRRVSNVPARAPSAP